jgi:hypothetical protein
LQLPSFFYEIRVELKTEDWISYRIYMIPEISRAVRTDPYIRTDSGIPASICTTRLLGSGSDPKASIQGRYHRVIKRRMTDGLLDPMAHLFDRKSR